MYEEFLKGPPNRIAPIMETKQVKKPRYLGEIINSLVLPDHPKITKQCINVIIAGDGATWQRNVS